MKAELATENVFCCSGNIFLIFLFWSLFRRFKMFTFFKFNFSSLCFIRNRTLKQSNQPFIIFTKIMRISTKKKKKKNDDKFGKKKLSKFLSCNISAIQRITISFLFKNFCGNFYPVIIQSLSSSSSSSLSL